jgi:hypothetical protein
LRKKIQLRVHVLSSLGSANTFSNVQTENLTQLSVHGVQLQGVAMEVKIPEEEATARRTADQSGDAEAGLIYSADYSSVAMHAASPPTAKPKHRHPTRP